MPQTSFPAAVSSLKTNVSDRIYQLTVAGITLPQLFLQKIEKNTTVTQRTLTLTFIDSSILLDKVYVGLVNQHASNNDMELFDTSPTNYTTMYSLLSAMRVGSSNFTVGGWTAPTKAGPTDPLPAGGLPIRSRLVNFAVNLNCEPCYSEVINSMNQLGGAGRFPSFRNRIYDVLRVIDYGRIVEIDHNYGGKIILGQEEYTEMPGDLANVTYSFSELLVAIKEGGIKWEGFVDINPLYRKNYTGTLREVLNSWAADMGFMHYWDFTKGSTDAGVLRCQFLNSAASPASVAMNAIKTVVYNPPKGAGFDSVNETTDMSATKSVNFQVYYKKPASPKSFQRRIQYRQIYQPIDPYDIFPASINGNRTKMEFDISCALAKFNKNARTLWNFYFTNAVATGNTKHLGIRILESISGPEMKEMLNEDFSCQQWEQIFDRYATNAVDLAACKGYVAVYSRQEEAKWEAWEAGVADMYGRYFVHEEQNDYMNYCGVTEKWEKEIQHTPAGQKIKGNDFGDLPFHNLIKAHPAGRSVLNQAYGSFSNNFFNITHQRDRMFTVFQRNAPWGTDSSQFDGAFVHSGVDFLEKLVPTYIPLNGKSKLRFFDRIKDVLADQRTAARIESKVSSAGSDAQCILLLAPPTNFLGNNFSVTDYFNAPHFSDSISSASNVPPSIASVGGWNNPNEYKEKDDRARLSPCKETYYEKDVKKEGCKCPTLYGWSPSGADISPSNPYGVVPIVTQDEEITMGDGLAPRPGMHLYAAELGGADRGESAAGVALVFPWANWGARSWDIIPLSYVGGYADLLAPFLRDEKQVEQKIQYGGLDWPLADARVYNNAGVLQPPSVESRYQLHLCQGFRVKSYAPGYFAGGGNTPTFSNPDNTSNPFSSASVMGGTSFYDPTGSGFMGPQVSVDIIFPSQNWYEGVKHQQVTYTKTERGQKQVRGRISDAGHSQAIEVNSMDITSDLEALTNPEGNTVVQVPLPGGAAGSAAFGFTSVGIDTYYNSVRSSLENVSVTFPRETLSFRQLGTDPLLTPYLTPAAGLDNFNLVLDQDGAYIDWSFATRPDELPKADVLSRKIGPMMNMNVIR
jgi:hypothetical protein